MKLEHLHIVGFQGIKSLEIDKPYPVLVFSGPNACGKSSVRDAIQFALDGSSHRCSLKKEYDKHLVNDQTEKKDAVVIAQIDGVSFQRKVATGQIASEDEPDFPMLMPFLIGSRMLSGADVDTIQRVCVSASKVKMSIGEIANRLIEKKADPDCVETVKPFLRGGFAAGLKEAKNQCTLARGEWKGITGDVYGAKKAKAWKAPLVDIDTITIEVNTAIQQLKKQQEELIAKRDKLPRAEPSQVGRMPNMNFSDIGACPACGVEIRKSLVDGKLYEKGKEPKPKKTDKPRPTETWESVNRLVMANEQAQGAETGRIKAAERENELAGEKQLNALAAHQRFVRWEAIADLLSPKGLPAELTNEALKPINKRLIATSVTTGWPITVISPDLDIVYEGRPYSLCSESEQWRIDAAIAEALAFVSGIKLFALDRMDILSPSERGTFIKWIKDVKDDHDSILVMATLKTEPKVPYGFTSIWLGE